MRSKIGNYESALTSWGNLVQKVQSKMAQTVGEIQEQESQLRTEINAINSNIAELKKQIQADREAIAKAQAEKSKGIKETILGIMLAPLTGGASLILAGIGVSSISEAEGKIKILQDTINNYQGKISGYQQQMTQDQKEISSLNGILLTADIVLKDIEMIGTALDPLKTNWEAFEKEINDVIEKIGRAENSSDIILQKAWYEAACDEWNAIVPHLESIQNLSLSTNMIRIK
jgi:peptidoglycan hydrolase CwlO-like protein